MVEQILENNVMMVQMVIIQTDVMTIVWTLFVETVE